MNKKEIIDFYNKNYKSVEDLKNNDPELYEEAINKYAIYHIDKNYHKTDKKFLSVKKEAENYKCIKDIRENNPELYRKMCLFNIEFFGLPKVYYSVEFLKSLTEPYKTITQVRNNLSSKYTNYIIENNLFDELGLEIKLNFKKLSISDINKILIDNGYKTYKDIRNNNRQLYNHIINKNIGHLLNLEFKRKPNSYWNFENLKQYIKENNINTLKELRNLNESAATSVSRLKLSERLGLIKARKEKWTEEKAIEYVNKKNFESVHDLRNDDVSLYSFLKKTGILPHLALVEKTRKWDEQSIKQFIITENIVSLSELIKKDMSVYLTARKLGIIDKLNIIIIDKDNRKESIKQIIERKKFKSSEELFEYNKNLYNYAKKYNLLTI